MKKRSLYYTMLFITWIMYACHDEPMTVKELKQYAATEIYTDDTILSKIQTKKAMIVLAHDDDMCALAGTASLLNKKGWEIAVISLSKTPERNNAQIEACRNILDTVMFVNLTKQQIRNDREEQRKGYYAIPKDSFNIIFNKNIIIKEYEKQINQFNPTIIFTLDNEMGGYGHAEHVLISQLVVDLKKENRIHPMYIYQSVYTNHMENSIMKRHAERMKSWGFPGDEWEYAKKVYHTQDGMPEPDVQVNIVSEAKLKMDYLRSYNERERKTIGFFVPAFEQFSAEEYFSIFNREFFRVIQ
ncbi:MAG: hypothetical protein MUC49_05695 [Raineya sp.]|nr:hypothetical protein [Raineya sp.]